MHATFCTKLDNLSKVFYISRPCMSLEDIHQCPRVKHNLL